jgi:hydroxymethylbilane synthase
MRPIQIGTRGSRLALWQANYVAEMLRALAGAVQVVEIQTTGDRIRDRSLAEIGGEGLFTKEIQRAVLERSVDVAVHSLKDLPTVPVAGLVLAAVPRRGSVHDVFVSARFESVDQLPKGAMVATSSPRRRAQLLHFRPDLQVVPIRGNVETRLRKLEEENLDGLILAEAGLERLGLQHRINQILDDPWMLPAVGQGALGIECREDDSVLRELLAQVDDAATRWAVTAERSLLRNLGGGCNVPIAALAQCKAEGLTLRAAVLDPDGKKRIYGQFVNQPDQAETLGQHAAKELAARGALELLNGRTNE